MVRVSTLISGYQVSEVVSIRTPEYLPVTENQVKDFSTEGVARWLSTPTVRSSLLKIGVRVDDIELGTRIDTTSFYTSPYQSEYQEYVRMVVLPGYVRYLSEKKPKKTDLIGRLLFYLITAATGDMSFPVEGVGHVITDIFPHMRMEKVSSEGNCYYCSVSLSLDIDPEDMRSLIADVITKNGDYKSIAKNYALGCGSGVYYQEYKRDPNSFIERFPSLLKKPCRKGEQDCISCVWGENSLDPYIANIFDVPVISVSLERSGTPSAINVLTQFDTLTASICKEYMDTSTIRYRSGQKFTLGFSYTFPEHLYSQYPSTSYLFSLYFSKIVAYLYKGNHFDAIKIK